MRTPIAISAALLLTLPAALLGQAQAPSTGGGTTPAATTPAAVQPSSQTPLLGQSRLTGAQMAAWFAKQGITPTITTPIADLANMFVDEGNAQNVRGDIAFAQSVLETGWFAYKGSMVKPTDNNFSGLGACDTCSRGAIFATPQEGVRAQIQHLWMYGDPKATVAGLARPLVDPRFLKVSPAGKSPTWEQMGCGNWATGTDYATQVLGLYTKMLTFNGLSAPKIVVAPCGSTTAPIQAAPASTRPTGPLVVMVSRQGGVRLGGLRASVGTLAKAGTAFGDKGTQRASSGACHVTWASIGAVMAFSGSKSGVCADDAHVRAAVLTDPIWKTDKGLAPGSPVARVRALYRARVTKKTRSVMLVKARNGASLQARIGEGVVKSLIVAVPAPRG